MAPPQAISDTREGGQQPLMRTGQGKRPLGIKIKRLEPEPSRKSARLQGQQDRTISENTETKSEHLLPFPNSNSPGKEQAKNPRKRRRSQRNKAPVLTTATAFQTRPPVSSPQSSTETTTSDNVAAVERKEGTNPLEYWTRELHWPKEYFELETMNHRLARKRSSAYLRGKLRETGSATPSSPISNDQNLRDAKSAPYHSPQYRILLEIKGSFMRKSELGISNTSKILCTTLDEAEQEIPENSLFQNDLFEDTCEMIQNRNEAKLIQDIARLLVPSAQSLALYGAKHLKILTESVNEGWDNSIAITKPRPQPDYAVGFNRTAFTADQLKKIQPYIGGYMEMSLFLGTYYMYFPFLTCESKCSTAALEIADCQNAHSMTLAVRGIVELFRLVKREKEVHREILAFSISHDHDMARIYGHYPVIEGSETTFYRHTIQKFSFAGLDGKDKWKAYKFTKNIYDIWMPIHIKRIRSAVDELPLGLDFAVSEQSEPQGLQSRYMSSHEATSMPEEADSSHSSRFGPRDVTLDASLPQRVEGAPFKKPKKRGRNVESHPGEKDD